MYVFIQITIHRSGILVTLALMHIAVTNFNIMSLYMIKKTYNCVASLNYLHQTNLGNWTSAVRNTTDDIAKTSEITCT